MKKGFTLVEALVSIFIITIISALFLANYRSGQKRYALEIAAQELISNIRRAQNMALAPEAKITGYGIHLDTASNNYILFANKIPSYVYSGGSRPIEKIDLPSKIIIESMSSNHLDIFFVPPEPTTYINGLTGPGVSPATITLKEKRSGLTKTIRVKTTGWIE